MSKNIFFLSTLFMIMLLLVACGVSEEEKIYNDAFEEVEKKVEKELGEEGASGMYFSDFEDSEVKEYEVLETDPAEFSYFEESKKEQEEEEKKRVDAEEKRHRYVILTNIYEPDGNLVGGADITIEYASENKKEIIDSYYYIGGSN